MVKHQKRKGQEYSTSQASVINVAWTQKFKIRNIQGTFLAEELKSLYLDSYSDILTSTMHLPVKNELGNNPRDVVGVTLSTQFPPV